MARQPIADWAGCAARGSGAPVLGQHSRHLAGSNSRTMGSGRRGSDTMDMLTPILAHLRCHTSWQVRNFARVWHAIETSSCS